METGYSLSQMLGDTVALSQSVVENMEVYLGFLMSNTAFMWVFIGGAAIFGLKILKGLGA